MKYLRQITEAVDSTPESIHFHKGMTKKLDGVNGQAFSSFKAPADWNSVSGQDHNINEPALPKSKKKISTGLIMHEPDGRVWMAKPTNEFGGYKHTFPKGKLEKSLHPQANAIKEAWEETGLKGKIQSYAGDAEGDTSITRYYHATREGGHPLEHGWESEGVVLAHPNNLHKFLNRSRDRQFAEKHLKAHMPHTDDEY
jgi:ADP-ribose pyrophosphatase YjhB (NUDIX family)